MPTTYGQIRFLLSKELPGVDVERLDGYINDRYQAILNKIDWQRARVKATLTTVPNQAFYTLPAGAQTMENAARLSSGDEIPSGRVRRVDQNDLNNLSIDRAITGRPSVWSPYQDASAPLSANPAPLAQVELFPTPNQVYSIEYWYTPDATLFGPNDTASLLPSWIDPGCLKAGVKADLFRATDKDQAQLHEAKFAELLGEIVAREARRNADQLGFEPTSAPTYGEVRFLLSQEMPGISQQKLNGYINDRYQAILNRIDWTRAVAEGALTTVAAQRIYTLPPGVATMANVTLVAPLIASPRVVRQSSRAELDRMSPDRARDGAPEFWAPYADDMSVPPFAQVELYPVPDQVYSLPYTYTPDATLFSTQDTASILPAWMDAGCLKAGVKADMFAVSNPGLAQAFQSKFKDLLIEMINRQSRREGSKKIVMENRFTRHRLARALRGQKVMPFFMP